MGTKSWRRGTAQTTLDPPCGWLGRVDGRSRGFQGKQKKESLLTDLLEPLPCGIRLQAISLFLENRGEERKTSKRASVSGLSVTSERRCRAVSLHWLHTTIWKLRYKRLAASPLVGHSHGYGFSRKRETARNLCGTSVCIHCSDILKNLILFAQFH